MTKHTFFTYILMINHMNYANLSMTINYYFFSPILLWFQLSAQTYDFELDHKVMLCSDFLASTLYLNSNKYFTLINYLTIVFMVWLHTIVHITSASSDVQLVQKISSKSLSTTSSKSKMRLVSNMNSLTLLSKGIDTRAKPIVI